MTDEDAAVGIAQALEDEAVSESDLLSRATARGTARYAALDPETAKRRLGGYLTRRGFGRAEGIRTIERACPAPGELHGSR